MSVINDAGARFPFEPVATPLPVESAGRPVLLGPTAAPSAGPLSDPDHQRVRLAPVDAMVEDLVALARPPILSPFARANPVEVTAHRVEARLLTTGQIRAMGAATRRSRRPVKVEPGPRS